MSLSLPHGTTQLGLPTSPSGQTFGPHISWPRRAGSLGSPRNAGKTHIPAGGGERQKGEFRNSLPHSLCPMALIHQSGTSGDPLPSPRVSSETRSLPTLSLIPAGVAMKAQDWAHPLQGQIQGSHWVAGSGRYSLKSEGQSQGSFRKNSRRQKPGGPSSKVLLGLSSCPSKQFTPWLSLPERIAHGSPGPGAGDPRVGRHIPALYRVQSSGEDKMESSKVYRHSRQQKGDF